MTYEWYKDNVQRQHWLWADNKTVGLVYEVNPTSFSVYGEDYAKNPYARVFLGIMPTLEEAKDLLLTITASQNI